VTSGKVEVKAVHQVRAARRGLSALKKCSLAVGGVGISTLGLSIVHCSSSISRVTGSPWWLAAALATTIDGGLVLSEVAEVAVHGTKAAASVTPWARAYIGLSISLSMALNALGSFEHAAPGMTAWSYPLGAVVPVLVFLLGRTAGLLWVAEA
jgi:hypothetical protein